MQLYAFLSRLPYTLVVSSLALAASAVPVNSAELLVLNPSNFKQTIAEGVWYVIFPGPWYTLTTALHLAGLSNTFLPTADIAVASRRHGSSWSKRLRVR